MDQELNDAEREALRHLLWGPDSFGNNLGNGGWEIVSQYQALAKKGLVNCKPHQSGDIFSLTPAGLAALPAEMKNDPANYPPPDVPQQNPSVGGRIEKLYRSPVLLGIVGAACLQLPASQSPWSATTAIMFSDAFGLLSLAFLEHRIRWGRA